MNTPTPKHKSPYMDRAKAVPKLIGNPDDFLIIGGLAGAAKDIGNMTQESPNTFLLGGAMGGASMVVLALREGDCISATGFADRAWRRRYR